MITVVALGNPGKKYTNTRHNIGWLVMEALIEKHGMPTPSSRGQFTANVTEGTLFGEEVNILFPTTFMNNSGVSAKKYMEEAGSGSQLVVVHDEIDLPLGEIKISKDRGAGGHNGVRSIIEKCGKDVVRIRLGVRHKGLFGVSKRPHGDKLSKYVLAEFKSGELKKISEIAELTEKALELIAKEGVEKAMQECN